MKTIEEQAKEAVHYYSTLIKSLPFRMGAENAAIITAAWVKSRKND